MKSIVVVVAWWDGVRLRVRSAGWLGRFVGRRVGGALCVLDDSDFG